MSLAEGFMSDPSEKNTHEKRRGAHFEYESTPLNDWNEDLCQLAKIKAVRGGKSGKGAGKGPFKRHHLICDNLRGITKPAFARLAQRGSVKRMSGLIYDEIRGVMKVFLEFVVRDAVIYTNYCQCCTVMVIDVIYALKHHGHNLYRFTSP